MTAIKPSHVPISPSILVEIIAPTTAMPEMAFDPDIKGVCKVGGTLVIISKPTKIARMKTVIILISIFNPYLQLAEWVRELSCLDV